MPTAARGRDLEDCFRLAGDIGGDWDHCYIGVLAAIAATPISVPVSTPQPQQLRFSFIECEVDGGNRD